MLGDAGHVYANCRWISPTSFRSRVAIGNKYARKKRMDSKHSLYQRPHAGEDRIGRMQL